MFQDAEIFGRGPKLIDFVLFDEFGHGKIVMRVERGTVIEDESSARGEPRDKPMPHHPGGCSVEKEAVARTYIAVELVLLFVLKESSQRAVDDAFGFASSTRGIEDVDWMGWGEVLKWGWAEVCGAESRALVKWPLESISKFQMFSDI